MRTRDIRDIRDVRAIRDIRDIRDIRYIRYIRYRRTLVDILTGFFVNTKITADLDYLAKFVVITWKMENVKKYHVIRDILNNVNGTKVTTVVEEVLNASTFMLMWRILVIKSKHQ